MKKYFKKLGTVVLCLGLLTPNYSHASIFGEEDGILLQILANALQQLAQLKQILQNGEDSLNLFRDINKGINNSLAQINSIAPYINSGLYGDLGGLTDILKKIQGIYGEANNSPEQTIYQNTDQTIAEAITMNNSIYDYTKNLDQIGEEIKQYSHEVSPGGAQKLTAQTLGVMIHVMNQQLRAQATGLKLSAQQMALQNKKDKDETAQYLNQANILKQAMQNNDVSFNLPRF